MTSHDARRILLQPHWLAAALSAAVFFLFALNRGGVEPAIWAAGLKQPARPSERGMRCRLGIMVRHLVR